MNPLQKLTVGILEQVYQVDCHYDTAHVVPTYLIERMKEIYMYLYIYIFQQMVDVYLPNFNFEVGTEVDSNLIYLPTYK